MSEANSALTSGLPDEVRQLLTTPPVTEKKLLELGVEWPALSPGQARMADALRLFVITWDPLEWHAGRPEGFATANADESGLELVLYVPLWSLAESAVERKTTMAAVLGSMAGSVVRTAAAYELAAAAGGYLAWQAIPDLLADPMAGSMIGPVSLRLAADGWEDIGLGAITDVVQHAFGPVDLDRSLVELAAPAEIHLGCPACAGGRFGFPGELAEAQDTMCPAHRREAGRVISTRIARANASNPEGWAAITDASRRLQWPHLPNGLAAELAGDFVTEGGDLARRARQVVEAARWFPGRPDELAVALGQDPDLADQFPGWLITFVLDLGRAGLGAEAVLVGDALALVDAGNQAMYDGDVAVALAQAGLAGQAQARVEANLARWPDHFWIRVHAGDALAALGDVAGAESHFNAALTMAQQANDFKGRHDVNRRLRQLGRRRSPDEPAGQRHQPRRKLSRSQRKRKR